MGQTTCSWRLPHCSVFVKRMSTSSSASATGPGSRAHQVRARGASLVLGRRLRRAHPGLLVAPGPAGRVPGVASALVGWVGGAPRGLALGVVGVWGRQSGGAGVGWVGVDIGKQGRLRSVGVGSLCEEFGFGLVGASWFWALWGVGWLVGVGPRACGVVRGVFGERGVLWLRG
jgi:hypothetical protein